MRWFTEADLNVVLGLDPDTPEVFDHVLDFVQNSGLYEVQVTFLTAFPGTPLYQRLKREGRTKEVGYSRFLVSITMVTGPSLVKETFMSAPKVPV